MKKNILYYYQVYFNNSLDYPFTYSSTKNNLERKRVLAPLRNKIVVGFVLERTLENPNFKIKAILEVLDAEPILDTHQIKLVRWISKQYLSAMGETLSLFFSYENLLLKKKEINLQKKIIPKVEQKIEEINLNIIQEKKFQENRNFFNNFNAFLIHGITGSGKTFFYLKIIKEIIEKKKQALIMVPEITLIFQIRDLCKRFFDKDKVAIFNSKLSSKKKEELKNRLQSQEIEIVIATRSGIFLPFKNLGIIVIDEEHENSYKNNFTPRYQVKQVAYYWAEMKSIPLVFASATPSVEIYYQAKFGKIKLIEFTERYKNMKLPKTYFLKKEGEEEISLNIYKKIFSSLEKKKQVLIYINQRGFSSTVFCKDCKIYFKCPHCEITLTYHKKKSILICHYCGYKINFNNQCLNCKGDELSLIKAGTEKIYEQIKERLQDYRVERFDSDNLTTVKKIESTLEDFKNNKIDILVGTQMIIKGHDFKNVSLVVVLDPEKYLLLPDYRSNERIFSHLIQVSGRAGRHGKEGDFGEVLIQTDMENHFCLLAAKQQSYNDFYKQEIVYRKIFNYPPFSKLIRFVFRGKDEDLVIKVAKMMKEKLVENHQSQMTLLGPSPCLLEKQKNYYRWNIILKVQQFNKFLNIIRKIRQQLHNKKVYIEVDISPVDLF